MKRTFVGIIIWALMATMIIPAFGATIESSGGYNVEEVKITETVLKENKVEESKLYETVIDEVYLTEDELEDYEFDSDCNYIVTIGGGSFIRVQVINKPGFVQAIDDGFSWIGEKCSNGFNHVKGWFKTNDE